MAKKNPKKKPPPAPEEVDTLTQTLASMHVDLAKELHKRIKDGTATAADLSVARAFLRDNGIEGNLERHKPLKDLTDVLPFAAEA